MKGSSNGHSPTPGVEEVKLSGAINAPEAVVADIDQIEKWLLDDIQRAIGLMHAIQSDPGLRHAMAVWFEGRISNYKHAADPGEINKPG
jgi:hypothetical protein